MVDLISGSLAPITLFSLRTRNGFTYVTIMIRDLKRVKNTSILLTTGPLVLRNNVCLTGSFGSETFGVGERWWPVDV